MANSKKTVKIVLLSVGAVLLAAILLVGGYLIYVFAQYYRIDDSLELEISNPQTERVAKGEEYRLLTYNLGFGAYSPDYSFFMDEGIMADGTKTVGKYAKAVDNAAVERNVNGQISLIKNTAADFCFLQEVDTDSDRARHVDMKSAVTAQMTDYSDVFAVNFHTANLLYPIGDPIGQSTSGILTLSRYRTESAVRRSFPVTDALVAKLFDLDRCFSVSRLPVEGSDKFLVLINLHMSAYDESGAIRTQQLDMLKAVLQEERGKGNYVIAGGDFNHCLIADALNLSNEDALQYFKSGQKTPEWIRYSVLHEREIAEGFRIAAPIDKATCRGADIPYEAGVTYETVVDGFLVSDNVETVTAEVAVSGYLYSDHNPVLLKFRLK